VGCRWWRWTRAADALAEGATLALIWNNEQISDPSLRTAMTRVIAPNDPSMVVRDAYDPDQVWHRWPGDELAGRPEFGDLASHHYESALAMPAADYLALTRTRSQFRMLPPPARQAVMAGLSGVFDDTVPLAVGTTVLLARRT
jgi:hypothetical protein